MTSAPEGTEPVVRLAMWSGPRNISTALMRSWESRADCAVIDEPLYAHYLVETALDHPGRDEVIEAGETDWRKVVTALLGPVPQGRRIYYQKHMAHHLLPHIDRSWLTHLVNVLLIRDPTDVLVSYRRSRVRLEPADLGLLQQGELYAELASLGAPPPVIDAADFLKDPGAHLQWLCELIAVPFTSEMLTWPPGPRDSDGVWAPYWYEAVLASTGFTPYRSHLAELERDEVEVVQACRPAYDQLADVRLCL